MKTIVDGLEVSGRADELKVQGIVDVELQGCGGSLGAGPEGGWRNKLLIFLKRGEGVVKHSPKLILVGGEKMQRKKMKGHVLPVVVIISLGKL